MKLTEEQTCSVLERKPIWTNRNQPGTFEFEREPLDLKVLVLHEDLPTGLRAKEALNKFENQDEIKPRFLINLFRFGMLKDAALAETALQQALGADMMFLSLHGDRELLPAVRDWLLRWLETRDIKPCALVVSLDPSTQDSLKSNPTVNFLRDITFPLEVDLFLHLGASPFTTKDRTMLVNRHISLSKYWI
jgi:hypothetical protein